MVCCDISQSKRDGRYITREDVTLVLNVDRAAGEIWAYGYRPKLITSLPYVGGKG
jgi:hypothetical protein